jgi:hypothetical protein
MKTPLSACPQAGKPSKNKDKILTEYLVTRNWELTG